jgi:hypothetical protein
LIHRPIDTRLKSSFPKALSLFVFSPGLDYGERPFNKVS